MALNPFFLQGSPDEQRLMQSLIDEHLSMFGVDVYYIPRKMIDTDDVLGEVQSSKFNDAYIIEAYLNNFEGYAKGSDIMTKFGINLQNEITLTVSRERYEDFIAPFVVTHNAKNAGSDVLLGERPKEGDLIYFPLGERLFEVKHVEHENPFYQLGKNYIYELQCELFRYEDEQFDTNVSFIDERAQEEGEVTTVALAGIGSTAIAVVDSFASQGAVQQIFLNDDGYGYTSAPSVVVGQSPAGVTSSRATAFAFTTERSGGLFSVDQVVLQNPGFAYTEPPPFTFGGPGVGAGATSSLTNSGITSIRITDIGVNYVGAPSISIQSPSDVFKRTVTGIVQSISPFQSAGGIGYTSNIHSTLALSFNGGSPTATAVGTITTVTNGAITGILLNGGGSGYESAPAVSITQTGIGTGADVIAGLSTTGTIKRFNITSGGSGYTFPPIVTLGGDASGQSATANITSGIVTTIQLDGVTVGTADSTNIYEFGNGTSIAPNGSGSGDTGGFNVGSTHLRFGGADGTRFVTLNPVDTTNVDTARVYAVRGNGSNGGETPDIVGTEDLKIQYQTTGIGATPDNSLWVDLGIVIPAVTNGTGTGVLDNYDFNISANPGSQSANTWFRLLQEGNSGADYDHYGILSVSFIDLQSEYASVPVTLTDNPLETATTTTATANVTLGRRVTSLALSGGQYASSGNDVGIVTVSTSGQGLIVDYTAISGILSTISVADGGEGFSVGDTFYVDDGDSLGIASVTGVGTSDLYTGVKPGQVQATAISILDGNGLSRIFLTNAGSGYEAAPLITIGAPLSLGIGTYFFNERVIGSQSGTEAYVQEWNEVERKLKLTINNGVFFPGEFITGTASSARYQILSHTGIDTTSPFTLNDEFEIAADNILDFTEKNPFGNF